MELSGSGWTSGFGTFSPRFGWRSTTSRTALVAFGVPMLWIVLGGLTLVGVELLVKYAGLLYFSLQG